MTLRSVIIKKQNARVESCLDAEGRRQGLWRMTNLTWGSVEGESVYVDGLQHGSSKAFDSKGRLLSTTEYEQGEEKDTHFSDEGLRQIYETENRKLIAEKSIRRLRLDPGRRIVYELHGKQAGASETKNFDASVFPQRLRDMLCGLIIEQNLSGADVEIYSRSGALSEKVRFEPADCQAFGTAASK
jgi:hypothetical protein